MDVFPLPRKVPAHHLIHRLIGGGLQLSTTDRQLIETQKRLFLHYPQITAKAPQHHRHNVSQPGDPPRHPEPQPGPRCCPLCQQQQPGRSILGNPQARSRNPAGGSQ